MKAMIFAAGLGSRLKPFTDSHPKALAPVNGVPLLERNIKYLHSFGVNEFVINVHHFANQITDFLKEKKNFGLDIQISDESDEVLETGGGLVKAREILLTNSDDFFFIMNADILTSINLEDLKKQHLQNKHEVTLAVSDRPSTRKLWVDENHLLSGWVNLLTLESKRYEAITKYKEYAFSGVHCMNKSYLETIELTGKFSIMEDYLNKMYQRKIGAFVHKNDVVDVGKPEAIAIAEALFK